MTLLSVKNWRKFQHYKDRNPPWIKLHFELLSSSDWVMLDDSSRVLAVACMLVASRNEGCVDGSDAGLAYLKRVAYLSKKPNLKPLIDCGFLESASGCKQMLADARPETETYKPETDKRFALPDWVPLEAWGGFCEMRKKSKSAFTERAKALLVAELFKLCEAGGNAEAILNQSTANGWKSVFPLKAKGGSNGKFNAVQYVAGQLAKVLDASAPPKNVNDLHGEVHAVFPRLGNG